MTDSKCVVCGKVLTGRQILFCSKRCAQCEHSRREARAGRTHRRYLARKAAGYYAATCACGQPKSTQSDHCLACERRRISPRCATCGKPTKGWAKQCRSCAHRDQLHPRLVKDEKGHFTGERLFDNPHCPNEEGRTACAVMRPHNHCKYCSWPIRDTDGMCADCIRAVERGACMTARDSKRYEERAA